MLMIFKNPKGSKGTSARHASQFSPKGGEIVGDQCKIELDGTVWLPVVFVNKK